MRFLTLTHWICLHTIDSAAVDVMRPREDTFKVTPPLPENEEPVVADSHPVPPSPPSKPHYPRIRARLGSLIRAWQSGSVPIPRFNHRTRSEVEQFLKYYGESTDGYFGFDKVHKPSLARIMRETVPGWLGGKSDPHMDIVFGKNFYNAGHTSVHEIIELPDKIIKYYAYCFHPKHDPIDSVVVETYFANRVAQSEPQVSVRVDFYSGSVMGGFGSNSKIPQLDCEPIETNNGEEEEFVESRVRYLIMPKVGKSLWQYMYNSDGNKVEFIKGMKLGGQIIDLLHRLHNLDIIHGDAHISNFAFTDDSNTKLTLIDFGRAQLLDPDFQRSVDVATFCDEVSWLDVYTGKWEMRSCKPSFRDDVYRAIQMVAMAIHGQVHYDTLNFYIRSGRFVERYIRIKQTGSFWEFGAFKIDVELPERADAVRVHLNEISRLTVEDHPEAPYTKPNYDGIKNEFKAIISLLTGTRNDDPHIFDL